MIIDENMGKADNTSYSSRYSASRPRASSSYFYHSEVQPSSGAYGDAEISLRVGATILVFFRSYISLVNKY